MVNRFEETKIEQAVEGLLNVMNILAVAANNIVNNRGVLLQGKLSQPLHLSCKCPYGLKTFVETIIHGSSGALVLFFGNEFYLKLATNSLRIFPEGGYGGYMFSV